MNIKTIDTPLGPMIAIADSAALYLLEFANHPELERKIERLKKETLSTLISGDSAPINLPIDSIEKELNNYFTGTLTEFKTPLFFLGTTFQKSVWQELQKIPFGQTRSYADIARALGKPTAYRAVAQANSSNQLPITIPCHRVISSDGKLSGYSGGTARKQWLLSHEKEMCT